MKANYTTAAGALACVRSGDRVFIHGSAATPIPLVKALLERHEELRNVELVSITNLGDINFNTPEFKKSFYFNSLFVSQNIRSLINENGGDYVPVFLSQIPQLFNQKILTLDVALIQVSAPDQHGYCSWAPRSISQRPQWKMPGRSLPW